MGLSSTTDEKSASNCLTFGSPCHADHRSSNDPFAGVRVVGLGGDGSVRGGAKSVELGGLNCDFDDNSVERGSMACDSAGQCSSDFAIPRSPSYQQRRPSISRHAQ